MTKIRKLIDDKEVTELDEPITLEVYTKCPEKWLLIDLETGERYIGHITKGNNHWKKIDICRTLT